VWSSAEAAGDETERAARVASDVQPAMAAVRVAADALEELVDDDLWPLPTYPEMLFLS
jgi:glutamine synthetase